MTTTSNTARAAFIADAKATASRAGLTVPERAAYLAAETARYDAAHMTQTEARREAQRQNESGEVPEGLVAVAVTNPPAAWGGATDAWVVAYMGAPN